MSLSYHSASVRAGRRRHGADDPQYLGACAALWVEAASIPGGSPIIGKVPLGVLRKVLFIQLVGFVMSENVCSQDLFCLFALDGVYRNDGRFTCVGGRDRHVRQKRSMSPIWVFPNMIKCWFDLTHVFCKSLWIEQGLTIAVSWAFCYCLLSSFAPVYGWLLALRFLSGFGTGGTPQS